MRSVLKSVPVGEWNNPFTVEGVDGELVEVTVEPDGRRSFIRVEDGSAAGLEKYFPSAQSSRHCLDEFLQLLLESNLTQELLKLKGFKEV